MWWDRAILLYTLLLSVGQSFSAVFVVEGCPYFTNQILHYNFTEGEEDFSCYCLLISLLLIFLALKKLCLTAFPIPIGI